MNPNYVHTITLFRKQDEAWTKTVLQNCFWKAGIVTMQSGKEASQANTYTVRLPLSETGEGFVVSTDDIVILGEVVESITGKTPDTATEVLLRYKPSAFKVKAFSDNTGHMADKHYRLGG